MKRVPLVLSAATALLLLFGAALFVHARGATNQIALASLPKGVTTEAAQPAQWRTSHRYIGTVQPWLEARIGPQLVSAYVDTVLVRPGAVVRRGEVIATLDCRNASAVASAVKQQARAVESTQAALASEAARMGSLLNGGFVSADELEQKRAESESKQAQLLALRAQAAGSYLHVSDCVLRAPFDGEIADRFADPGSFARPGQPVATLVDRHLVRIAADVPEEDFDAIAPGAPVGIHLIAGGRTLKGAVARRSPGADPATRTVHFEIDLANARRELPIGTTAELQVESGAAAPASRVPLNAATVRGGKASLFLVDGGVARAKTVRMLGEREGTLFVEPLPEGAQVVTEGRAALADGDKVQARKEGAPPPGERPVAAEVRP